MKNIFLLILISAVGVTGRAQWQGSSTVQYFTGGNVGIGTSSPAIRLHVSGGHVAASNSDMSGFVQLWADNALIWKVGNANGGFRMGTASDLGANSWNELARFSDNGNFGIGTQSPSFKLELKTTTQGDGLKIGYTTTGFVRLHPNSIQAGWYNPITQQGDAGLIYGGTNVDAGTPGFIVAPWSATQGGIRLDAHGNVGINTANTNNYQLAVNGSAIFTAAFVKPYANWPDYVFDRGYALPSLTNVSSYIRQHHHLPDLPSADSIQTKGVDLGGTQAALLKKIEELTLYAIDQDKAINELKDIQRQLQKQNELLSQQLNSLEKRLSSIHTTTHP
jgi:hypothetical protein